MLKTRKVIKITQEEKELIRKRIDYIMGVQLSTSYEKLKKIFGKAIANNIDFIIEKFHYRMWVLQEYDITYLDIYMELEKELHFIFDVEFDDITDCHIGSLGSLYPDSDDKVIEIPWRY